MLTQKRAERSCCYAPGSDRNPAPEGNRDHICLRTCTTTSAARRQYRRRSEYRAVQLQASLWLSPDDAEKVGTALLAAVAAWRGES